MENFQHENQPVKPEILTNSTTKAELLRRAKDAVDAGEQRLHDAADALALAQEDFKATQREIAQTIGRSASWVNRLLKWRRSGYKEHSPFGPTTTAGRVSHAKRRTKKSRPREATVEDEAAAGDAQASTDKRKAENERLFGEEPEPATSAPEPGQNPVDGQDIRSPHPAGASTSRKLSPSTAREELRYAINHWWPHLDAAGKSEITAYFMKKSGVQAS